VTRVLQRERGLGAGQDGSQARGRTRRQFVARRAVTSDQVVLAKRARCSTVRSGELHPRAVGHHDLPLLAEDRDVRRQRIKRRLQKVALAGRLLLGKLRLGDVLRGATNTHQPPVRVADRP
jgi:hypothetical protein